MPQRKTGVILVNLGTPKSPTTKSVRRFLREFLSDPRVVDAPRLFWIVLLNTIILPLRAGRVARAYKSIWTEDGSPLRKHSQALAEDLAGSTAAEKAICQITWAMTYGEPTLASRLEELVDKGVAQILVVPLYPQFSSTTTGPVYDRLLRFNAGRKNIADIRCVHDYFDHPGYINALANSVQAHWRSNGRKEKLLMSFHGLPESYVKAGDPYIEQCKITAGLLAEKLELSVEQWAFSFQSRFGPAKWAQPYTDDLLVSWAEDGINNINIICPSFATDCLETLEEVGQQYKQLFQRSGGNEVSLIPCLNSSPEHVALLKELIIRNCW